MRLDERGLASAAELLAAHDADLAAILRQRGLPPLWSREPGFPTLVRIMLEQQVSLASARAAFDRLCGSVDPLTPSGFLALDDAQLLAIGFSRQKARYVRELARSIESGRLDLDRLDGGSDDEARRALLAQLGIGPWTADIYLLMALGHPDVWPSSDMALAQAVAEVKGLPARPDPAEMEALAEPWRPWRSVAARLFWLEYLARRGRPV